MNRRWWILIAVLILAAIAGQAWKHRNERLRAERAAQASAESLKVASLDRAAWLLKHVDSQSVMRLRDQDLDLALAASAVDSSHATTRKLLLEEKSRRLGRK